MSNNRYFTFQVGMATNVGCVRQVNEDSYLSRSDFGLWTVSDGMGGHMAGDFASQTIVRELNSVGVPGSADDLEARLMERLTRANQLITEHAISLNQDTIGATVVSLLIYNQQYSCVWSGDSRAYLLRDGGMEQISEDHTEVQSLLKSGRISAQEAANWPRKNVITNAIGVGHTPQCDIITGEVQHNDYFLLCSDGLTEHFDNDEIEEYLNRLAPQQACDDLVNETLNRGARDNVTILAIQCHARPEVPPSLELELMDEQ